MNPPSPDDVPPIDDWARLLEGRVAVVTGGGGGIGRSISTLFASHGATVEIADADSDRAEDTRREIADTGGVARSHHVDVTVSEDVERLASAVLDHHGRCDVLVNNVGDYRPRVRFEDSGTESWDAMYALNLRHVIGVTRSFIGSMITGGQGAIVNVHSVEGLRGYPGDPVYAAMKAAVAHFTTSLAVAVGRRGVRVNGIGPDLTQSLQVDYLARSAGHEELWRSWAPVGRLGWPDDQARVALFLASDLSAYVTGHNIPVDGGTKAGGGWFYSPSEGRFVNRPTTL